MILDAGAARAWLLGPEVVRDDGAVMSWSNPAHPGYPYPEIAGLWLCAFADDPRAPAVRRWLVAQLDDDARLGRDGVTYAFDAAVALRGLRAAREPDATLRAVAARLAADLRDGPVCGAPAPRWSASRGPHLLKCAIALQESGIELDEAALDLDRGALLDARGLRLDDGTGRGVTYLHAHLYALEARLWLAGRGHAFARAQLLDGARWTAWAQDPSGGLRAWHDGARAEGPLRADATAQAVRLWSAVDREVYAAEIARGRGFLARCQHPSGGLRYEPGSDDVNVWATIFGVQAEAWARDGARGAPW
ncbi:MAG: hypothetical protein R3A48_08325 [Polyangiales bacterium]